MKKSNIILIVLAVIVVIVIGYVWSGYNKFVGLNEGIAGSWAQVETQYQKRLDLIPNLVNSVKGVMAQETSIFTAIANARQNYAGATTPDAKAKAASEVDTSLGRLIAIMENYPVLKSSDTVQTLMSQIEGMESRISAERGRYNEAVKTFNVATKRFPASIIASVFGFSEKNYFEATQGAEVAPTVNLQQ
jgi:LemA protein